MSAPHRRRRRGLPRGGPLIAGVLAGAALAAPAGAEVGPGRSLELDQSIELGIVDGYPNGRDVRIDVLRGATLIATKTVPGGGAVDINHIGGRTYTPVTAADTWALTIPAADLAALAD